MAWGGFNGGPVSWKYVWIAVHRRPRGRLVVSWERILTISPLARPILPEVR